MPPKKKSTKQASAAPEASSPERFEKELKDLAAKAQEQGGWRWFRKQASIYIRTGILLTLVAAACNASYLALTPVYGAIPTSVWHSKLVMAAAFAGWSGNVWLSRILPFDPAHLLPVFAAYIPTVQFFLFSLSGTLTARYGPAVTELLTLFPLVALSSATVANLLEGADLSMLPSFLADAGPGIGSWALFKLAESLTGGYMHVFLGWSFLTSRVGYEILLSLAYTLFASSNIAALAIPAMYHTSMLNYHVPTPAATAKLNSTLQAEDWLLLDRRESTTGYISVMESLKEGYRVLRCDHSLLGGEWTKIRPTDSRVSEPIYGVFVMLEAVRLVQIPEPVPDSEAKALVVGLGIGTTPSGLVAHGIDTTVVEIDPVVHEFASKHFTFPANHTAVIDDAVSYTASLAETDAKFDYIVHDVFTGGAEPVDLFTLEFLQGLNTLLKPDGVIAINYAGDFMHPAPKIVVNTIKEVFPTCRIFRESPEPDAETLAKEGQDFTNMVIFCKKTAGDITFRDPIPADFLGSRSRQAYLMPRHEVRESSFKSSEDGGIMRKNETQKLAKWHQTSALGHWDVMRIVIPGKIWELW
ncbi:spermine/spermidine synthase family protein [Sodiomyces alkalinus F11]|uniref:Spermine/spermidine synthase family protein n=1 Tax=Sodiomyces alkalinus (strain CBS 110278 / VKM F-3762 / F11) TaxID=1314773 RepID=A0A3N2PKP3_SODAK|nr:spermine/spermidine synthase family protein [Sodiomyces alkalinus F11]ROT34896.1 spermine/spermidine synthase family protein [Sodiomyces alkalinus F11]